MPADPRRSFGVLLRKYRKKVGKTLGDLADELDVSVVYVSDVERGNRAPLREDYIEVAARVLNADARELHRAAAEARGAFKLRAERVPPAAREVVAGLARGEQYPDTFWEELVELASKHRERDK